MPPLFQFTTRCYVVNLASLGASLRYAPTGDNFALRVVLLGVGASGNGLVCKNDTSSRRYPMP